MLEKELRANWDAVFYPEPEPEVETFGEEVQSVDDPVLLAAGPSGTMTDAGPARIDLRGMAVPDKQTGATPRINARTGRPITGPSMSDITEPAMGMLNMGAATVKGAVQGFAGLPGDVEALAYGIKELFNRGAGEGKIDAFLRGMSEQTIMPRTDEIRKWLDANVGTVAGGQNPYETIGEVVAPAGQIKAAKAAVKGVAKGAKALAPKAGELAEDYLRRTGQIMDVAPPGPSAAPARAAAPVSDMGFYSAVEQAALNTQRKSGPGQAFLNDILKGENVKADEVKWIGLDEFLKGKKNVTREEVQQFIAANKVNVQEVALTESARRFTNLYEAIAFIGRQEGMTPQQVENNFGFSNRGDYIDLANDMAQTAESGSPARFMQYTLPGGQNYREILLTMPTKDSANATRRLELMSIDRERPLTDAESAELKSLVAQKRTGKEQETFTSSHWDQKNILAHLRVNDRVDADGKKMLLIEEVQSDWHQAGREKGYKPRNADLMEQRPFGEVPDAPMKDTWYQLALKRALKYAADNGYERVGITTGARQAERYDLSKQVSRIKVNNSRAERNTVNLDAYDLNGNRVIAKNDIGTSDLDDLIGKEMADRVRQQLVDHGKADLSGVDLKFGGEGMKKYYDEVYPQFLAKYGKKWDAKVGQTTVQADGAEPVRYIDITPQMRESVGKGQPLFTAVPAGTAAGAAMQDKEQR